jgi:hypothetical protein
MVLEQIQARFIAGFTVVSLLVIGLLGFEIKKLKYELEVEKQKVRYYQQQAETYKQQIKELQTELNSHLFEI